MFKKLLAFFAAMTVAVAFAAVDVNKATPAELDGIKGIGPSISNKIVDERKKGNFKSWEDFIERVKGVGQGNAAKFSAEGLTVGGAGFKGATANTTKKDDKPAAPAAAAKVDAKTTVASAAVGAPAKTAAKPVAAASSVVKEEKKDSKADAKNKKDVEAKVKADEKKAKSDAKSDTKSDAKADAAKPAASAAKK